MSDAEQHLVSPDVEDSERDVFVPKASSLKFRPLAALLVCAAAVVALIASASTRGPGRPVDAEPSAWISLDADTGEQVDFYAFTHVGNIDLLPDILEYPLKDMVDGDGVKGILVMYVMMKHAFQELLDHIDVLAKDPEAELPEELTKLHDQAGRMMHKANAPHSGGVFRVRILTPYDFKEPLLSIRLRLGKSKFQEWFAHTTYDAPKFVDALLRLRSFGNNIPVFRFDIDVLFNKYTKDDVSSITNAISHGVSDFAACVADPYTQSFLVSQQYGAVKAADSKEFNAWNEAYSTRANPALLATKGTTDASGWSDDGGWGNFDPSPEVLQEATSEEVMLAFYGLQKVDGEDLLQPTIPSSKGNKDKDILNLGNAYIGANPSRAVISGAALAVGPGTSVDMPPFLHVDLNIMWIDDHLFDRLTQEVSGTKRNPRPAGVGQARVVKARSQPHNLAKFTLEIYMPTLIYGVFMDAWVNNHTEGYLLKYSPSDLPQSLQGTYDEVMEFKAQGPWSKAMKHVRDGGQMLPADKVEQLKDDLWTATFERAKDVYWQWGHLPQPEVDGEKVSTFATLWGTGRICEHENLANYCDNDGYNALGRGMVTTAWDKKAKDAKSRAKLPAMSRDDINPALAEKVDDLVGSAVKHLRWTLTWPSVVQAIRSEMVGHVPSDVLWHDKAPVPELGDA